MAEITALTRVTEALTLARRAGLEQRIAHHRSNITARAMVGARQAASGIAERNIYHTRLKSHPAQHVLTLANRSNLGQSGYPAAGEAG
jgi:hypothetical protein